jgi:sigma-B regulation protein RsbU (phosphoserine phosphatase)
MTSGKRLPWKEELAIIDRTMEAISGITDPNELVRVYWEGIGDLVPIGDYVSLSRRGLQRPFYRITRSSRFAERINPWTERDRLPLLSGGLLEDVVYANKPVMYEDLPDRLADDDPAHFYLQGFQTLIALPQYDGGESLNVTGMLLPAGSEFDYSIIPTMHWHAGLFGRGTTNLVLRNQLSAALSTLDRELQVVGDIQRSLLPQALPKIPGFEVATFYSTSAQAGGDYYDFFPLKDDGVGVFIADVAGHGTPAAVLMAITHAIAHGRPGTHTPPVELLRYLNQRLASSYTRGRSFVTAFYAVLDPASRTFTYSRAGHNPPRLVRDRQVSSLEENGALPLGIFDAQPYTQTTVNLKKGDLLLLYTDGITEANAPIERDKPRRLFGVERLDDLLSTCGDCTAEQCVQRIRDALAEFCQDAQQIDDQTLIAIRCVP